MLFNLTTRRGFAARLAALLPGLAFAGAAAVSAAPAGQGQGGVQKLDGNGNPSDGKGFITPLIIHNGLIYIAGHARIRAATNPMRARRRPLKCTQKW
jgi:hypothetical protein